MNNILKLTLIAVLLILVINFLFSSLFSYFHISETEENLQKSSLYLEQAKKNQEAYLEAKYQASNNVLKQQLEIERQINLQIQSSQNRYSYKTNEQIQEERFRQQAYEKIRQEKRESRKQKEAKVEEIAERKRELERADRAHVRNENIKTCTYWRQQYKEISSAKNKAFKEDACSRAYR
jgi:membrane protein involved in colicin uptake